MVLVLKLPWMDLVANQFSENIFSLQSKTMIYLAFETEKAKKPLRCKSIKLLLKTLGYDLVAYFLHSAVTALLEAADSCWSLNIDRGFVNAVIFLDLKKAFDTGSQYSFV